MTETLEPDSESEKHGAAVALHGPAEIDRSNEADAAEPKLRLTRSNAGRTSAAEQLLKSSAITMPPTCRPIFDLSNGSFLLLFNVVSVCKSQRSTFSDWHEGDLILRLLQVVAYRSSIDSSDLRIFGYDTIRHRSTLPTY